MKGDNMDSTINLKEILTCHKRWLDKSEGWSDAERSRPEQI